jgi:hypothetical protein
MVAHMKTTVEISAALLDNARKAAGRRGTTLRALIEEGLRQVLKTSARRPTFTLSDASFKGEGIDPAFGDDWDRVRDAIYKGRGA